MSQVPKSTEHLPSTFASVVEFVEDYRTTVPDHVFAEIKPSTRTRIDFGFALGKFTGKIPARLIDTGGKEKKDRLTHRIPVTALTDIDAAVKKWLKTAYELDE